KSVDLPDAIAGVGGASQIALDGLIDAVFAGKPAEADVQCAKARDRGEPPPTIACARIRALGHVRKLRMPIAGGDSIELAITRRAQHVLCSREHHASGALRVWTPQRLIRAMEQLADASLEMRQNAPLSEAIAQRPLLSLAMNARKSA